MKYIDALKKYNEGSDKWCMPKKGSEDYIKIINMMKKISNIKKSKEDTDIKDVNMKSTDKKIKILQAAIKRRLIIKKNKSTSIEKKISDSIKRVSKNPSYSSDSRVFSNEILESIKIKNMKTSIIQKFLNDKLKINKYKLLNRINRYNLLKPKLSLLKDNDCLEKKVFNGEKGFTIRGIINLEKKMGTKSKYGLIYKTSIPKLLGIYPIASKIMKNDKENKREIQLMTIITQNIILNRLSRHFIMIYGYCECSKKIAPKLKLLSINELADGDLKMLTCKRKILNDDELLFNLLFQTYISIATFQNMLKYVHRDAHYGNFLYQENNEIGYYHYIFNGKDYYLKSCKYNIIIFDFGFANEINDKISNINVNITIAEDYLRIIPAFMNKKMGGWVKINNLPKDIINNKIYEIINRLAYMTRRVYPIPIQKNLFADIIDEILLKYTPAGMFITQRPSNVINNIPFRID
jgi:hypothetical protein